VTNAHNDKLIIALGIFASILLFFATFSYEVKEEKLLFLSSANNAFNKVKIIFSTLKRINKELGSRFYLADELGKDEFKFFAQSHITQNQFIEEILFAEKVELKDKTQYELNFKNKGYSGFSIKPFPDNSFSDSFSPDTLFPIKYIEPYSVVNSRWFGRDILTYPIIKNAIQATLGQSNSLIYTTDSNKNDRLYATRALYSGGYGHTSNKSFQDIFGLLLYKIKIHDVAPDKKSDFATIRIGGNTALEEGTISPTGLFTKTFK
jgi:CHASE domain